jgi:outer membrane protein OmpA-like peptidoglycan-associated protein
MSRIFSTLAATTALALAAFSAPVVSAFAAAPYDGTWVIDVPPDIITGTGGDPTCPALRLWVQVSDNQVSANFTRFAPGESNIVENAGTNGESRVIGQVQPDGAVTAQWQNFHTTGRMVGDSAALIMQSECGPMLARAHRLGDETMAMSATTSSGSGSSEAEAASSNSTGRADGYNVYFAFDRSNLTSQAHDVVASAVGATQGGGRIALVGKADRSGTDPYNMALSQRRADTVRDAMIAGGVPADRIDTRWVGEREPPDPTANGVRDPQNRVVEVAIH